MDKPILKCYGKNDNGDDVVCVEIYKDHTSPVGSFDFRNDEDNQIYLDKFINGELTQYMACFRRYCKCCKQYGQQEEWLGAMHHTTSREAFFEYTSDVIGEEFKNINNWELYEKI